MTDIFKSFIRPVLFSGIKADPEWLHNQSIKLLTQIAAPNKRGEAIRQALQSRFSCYDPRLEQQLWGLSFANPLGLAAGFDKNAEAIRAWPAFGFGFCEVGTVTCQPQPGNPKPRMFRLLEDQAALNRLGFNNVGAAAMAEGIQQQRGDSDFQIPLGINLGKSKTTPLNEAVSDYLESFQQLKAWGDYFVINVSSPNTPGLRSLQATEQLEPILAGLQGANDGQKPLLVKIAPDLSWDEIHAVLDLALQYQLSGVIATNTTIRRDHLRTKILARTGRAITEEAGGISGAPLRQRSTAVIHFIWKETQGQLPIIGVGGIFTAADAWEKLAAGASLLQVYTGWIYEGPAMVQNVMGGLLERLEQNGIETVKEVVGLAHRNSSVKSSLS